MPQPIPRGLQVQVAPVHFEDFSGEQFERLAFAYILRNTCLHSVEWTGQSGRDGGKDILALDDNNEVHLFLCANYRLLTFKKARSDIAKISTRPPDRLRSVTIVTGGKVSDGLRKKTKAEILAKLQISEWEVWSGTEFEERLRLSAPDLLKRYVHGEPFPELPEALRALAISSVEDAMAVDVKKIEALDPRWSVDLDVINSAKHYRLQPKETISALLKVNGSNVAKMKDHFDYGHAVTLDGSALAVEGVPLFSHLLKEKGEIQSIAVTPAKPLTVEFSFWTNRPDGFRFSIPGQITRGHLGLSFISQLSSGAPLRIQLKLPRAEVSAPSGKGTMSFSFAFEEWENRSIASLPFFDKVRGFAHAIVEKHLIHHEVTVEGNRVTGGTLGTPENTDTFEFAAAVIENVARARQIIAKLGGNVILPNLNALAADAFEEVDFAHTLLFGDTASLKGNGFSVGLTLQSNSRPPAEVIAALDSQCAQGGLAFTKIAHEMSIYGTLVSVGDVSYSVDRVRLVLSEPERSDFLAGRRTTLAAKIESLPESQISINLVSE